MFIVEPIKAEDATGELKLLYKKIKKMLGFIPPHFELFATIDTQSLIDFLEYNMYFYNHPNIDEALLPCLRLCIAQKECRRYCIKFNTELLQRKGIDKKLVNDIYANISKLPFDARQKLLLGKVIDAIYNADKFGEDDLKVLYDVGFNDKDFYDLLRYGTNFSANSKMIEAYLR